jgi:hypothetical protein
MGPLSVASYLLEFLIFEVLAAFGFMERSKRGKCYSYTCAGDMLQIWYTVTAAGADASCIYLESFSFSLLCTIECTHTVLPNFHIVTTCQHY